MRLRCNLHDPDGPDYVIYRAEQRRMLPRLIQRFSSVDPPAIRVQTMGSPGISGTRVQRRCPGGGGGRGTHVTAERRRRGAGAGGRAGRPRAARPRRGSSSRSAPPGAALALALATRPLSSAGPPASGSSEAPATRPLRARPTAPTARLALGARLFRRGTTTIAGEQHPLGRPASVPVPRAPRLRRARLPPGWGRAGGWERTRARQRRLRDMDRSGGEAARSPADGGASDISHRLAECEGTGRDDRHRDLIAAARTGRDGAAGLGVASRRIPAAVGSTFWKCWRYMVIWYFRETVLSK